MALDQVPIIGNKVVRSALQQLSNDLCGNRTLRDCLIFLAFIYWARRGANLRLLSVSRSRIDPDLQQSIGLLRISLAHTEFFQQWVAII